MPEYAATSYSPSVSWILQCNPERFDIDRYLAENDDLLGWFIRQRHFVDRMEEGDEVFIWRSDGGRKDTGGIIARARVVGSPEEMSGQELKSYYRTTEWRHVGIGVWLDILEVKLGDGMIKRSSLLTHPILRSEDPPRARWDQLSPRQRGGYRNMKPLACVSTGPATCRARVIPGHFGLRKGFPGQLENSYCSHGTTLVT